MNGDGSHGRVGLTLASAGLVVWLMCAESTSVAAQTPTTFRHPGVLVNKAQLDFVKAKVNAGVDPWLAGFNAPRASSYASLS